MEIRSRPKSFNSIRVTGITFSAASRVGPGVSSSVPTSGSLLGYDRAAADYNRVIPELRGQPTTYQDRAPARR